MSDAVDRARQRAEIDREVFSRGLRAFVDRWAPDPEQSRPSFEAHREFQHDLMRLFVDAMHNTRSHLSLGIDTYASTMFEDAARRPLHVIMERPKS